MMEITQMFTCSLTDPRTAECYAVQGDSARLITAQVYAGEEPWEIPDGVTAEVGYELPDGTKGAYDRFEGSADLQAPACCFDGNRILMRLAAAMCRTPGTVKAVITLRKDGRQLSIFPFRLHVAQRPGLPDDPAQWPDPVPAFAGRLYWGGSDGTPCPLELGEEFSVEEERLKISPAARMYFSQQLQEHLDQLRADLLYEPIEITGIWIQPATALLGSRVQIPLVSWSLSREPVMQKLQGQELEVQVRERTAQGSFGPEDSVELEATDERGAVARAQIKIAFYNVVYYGKQTGQQIPADQDLWRLEKKTQRGLGLTISADAGDGEYILYAAPSRYGTPKFWCGGLQAAFVKAGSLLHTNPSGYQEEYDVWISEADGLRGVDILVE